MAEREERCWSNNPAVGYANALYRCISYLRNAVEMLEQDQVPRAQSQMHEAQRCMDSANAWFNLSNNEHFRNQALVREVKALRAGTPAITYAAGCDPIDDNWSLLQSSATSAEPKPSGS